MAIITQARRVIDRYPKIEGDKEIILTEKWWEHVRFSHFGHEMAAKFKAEPALKAEFREMFKSQNDKCSYYDLF